MDTSNLQLTPEMRDALAASPDTPIYITITDQQTRRIYMLMEQGKFPELEENYVRDGLELARTQIARGEVSRTPIDELIAEVQLRHAAPK